MSELDNSREADKLIRLIKSCKMKKFSCIVSERTDRVFFYKVKQLGFP